MGINKTRLVCLFVGFIFVSSLFFSSPVHASNVEASPATLSFGSVTVNTTSSTTFVVTNIGGRNLPVNSVTSNNSQFVVSGPTLPVTLAPQASVTFQVTFEPNSAATFSGSITVKAGQRSGQVAHVAVSGTGAAAAAPPATTYLLSPSVSSLAFGNQLVGTGASQTFGLSNTGTSSVTISQVASTGAGFSVSGFSSAVTLAAGQSLSLGVSFAPAAAGSVTGSISVVSTATNSPATISLSGTGVQPAISVVPSSVSFGSVITGVTNTQTITVQNPGSATLSVTQASLSGTGYSLSGLTTPLSIAPGSSASFNAGFDPASAGSFSGSLVLTSNAPSSPTSIALSGTGVAATMQLSASPTSLSFGSLTTGTSAAQTLTLTSSGNSSVKISQITPSGAGFSICSMGLPLTLATGQSAACSVTFAPSAVGSASGSITVTSNATNSPLVVALSGTGTAPVSYSVALSWTPSSSSYEGFNVYRSTVSGGPYTKLDSSLIPTASYTDSNVTAGQTYYYVATEVDDTGTESAYSSQISAAIP